MIYISTGTVAMSQDARQFWITAGSIGIVLVVILALIGVGFLISKTIKNA
jgi:hypothetical protein